jgi:hypothetical protein
MKDSFIFYRSFYESIRNLDKDIQIEIYNAICEYSLNDKNLELSPIATAIFTLIKPNIDNATKRYNASVENGKKGGRPKKEKPNENLKKPNNNLDKTKTEPNQNLNVYVDVYEDVDVDDDVDKDEDVNKDIVSSNILSFPSKDETEVLKEEFEKLWKLYPKKIGKEKAFNKYKKYRTSKGDEYCTYEEVLSGLELYLKYIKQNTWYSPKDGSTWFNNRSWNDEYDVVDVPSWVDKEITREEATPKEIEELEAFFKEIR